MKKTIRLTETNLTNLIRKIILEIRKTPYEQLKEIILDSIDFEGYDIDFSENKFKTGLEIFEDEYGYEIRRSGKRKAFIEYLLGLPSWISIPMYYYDIRNMMYSIGFDEVKEMEDRDVADMYYEMVTDIFFDNV